MKKAAPAKKMTKTLAPPVKKEVTKRSNSRTKSPAMPEIKGKTVMPLAPPVKKEVPRRLSPAPMGKKVMAPKVVKVDKDQEEILNLIKMPS